MFLRVRRGFSLARTRIPHELRPHLSVEGKISRRGPEVSRGYPEAEEAREPRAVIDTIDSHKEAPFTVIAVAAA